MTDVTLRKQCNCRGVTASGPRCIQVQVEPFDAGYVFRYERVAMACDRSNG